MVKIGSLPIIRHIINYYKSFGFNEFILATGYKGILENISKKEIKIKCIFTGNNTLTGEAIKIKKIFFKRTFYTYIW